MENKNALSVIIGSIALGLLHNKAKNRSGSMSEIEILEQIEDAEWLIENNRSHLVKYATIRASDLSGFEGIDWSLFPDLESVTIIGASIRGETDPLKVGNVFNRKNFGSHVEKYGLTLKLKNVLVEDPENILNASKISVLSLENSPFEHFEWSKINKEGEWSNLVISGGREYRNEQPREVFIPNEVFQVFSYLIQIDSTTPILLPETIDPYVKQNSWGVTRGLSSIAIRPVANKYFPKFTNTSAIYELSLWPSRNHPHVLVSGYDLKKLVEGFKYLNSETSYSWNSGDLRSLVRGWNEHASPQSELRKF